MFSFGSGCLMVKYALAKGDEAPIVKCLILRMNPCEVWTKCYFGII